MPLAIDTHHSANIFGVRFLPCTDNRQLVSGAMDHTVSDPSLSASVAAGCFALLHQRSSATTHQLPHSMEDVLDCALAVCLGLPLCAVQLHLSPHAFGCCWQVMAAGHESKYHQAQTVLRHRRVALHLTAEWITF